MKTIHLPNGKTIEHNAIDYKLFDTSGRGKNILDLLNQSEKSIWEKALPLQDKRDDVGHAEVVTYFALKLTNYIGGNREIIIPAAILHDTGWSQINSEELKLLFATDEMVKSVAPDAIKGSAEWINISRKLSGENERSIRLKHQTYGVNIAKEILGNLGYTKYISEIEEIISQHDTRKGFYSEEDSIVRDADKLWRHTYFELERNMRKRNEPANFFYSWSMSKLDPIKRQDYVHFEVSRQIAIIETEEAVRIYSEKTNKKKQ